MRLVSFNTGIIRPQIIDGEVVRTAHVKSPEAQPWIITPSGAAGDQVAVHSDHLYAFDRAGYDHWAQELGVARRSWPDGHFAENLTLDTLDQSQLRVGDHYRVGEATIVVTGPRVPCWKLTWRLGQPKSFMRRFRLSGRSGAYFGVVRPGRVRPEDRLVLIGRDEGAPTVAELSRLCDSGTRITAYERTVINVALASNHLSATVRGTLDLKVAALERDGGASAPGWPGWRPFEIGRVVHETADTASFHLRPADGGRLPGFRAGQHVVARLNQPSGRPIVRTWSLSSYASHPDTYRITVRRRPVVRDGLVAAGANPDLVRVEDFGAASVLPSRHTDAVVRYAPSGVEATWVSKDERTLLELAEDSGLEVPYDCRAGTCRTCESRLTCGDVDGPVTEAGDGTRHVLLCVSYPRSGRVVVEPPAE